MKRLLIPLLVLWTAAAARAAERPLNDLLPYDTLAFAEIDGRAAPGANGAAGGSNTLIDMGLSAMQTLGVMPNEAGMVADMMGLLGEAGGGNGGRRSCVAWLDADLLAAAPAKIGPPGAPWKLECKSVQLVWVLETDKPAEMIERLTRLLSHLSTRATVRQSVRQAVENKKEFVEFWDTRWPEWLTLAWAAEPAAADGSCGPRFVLALGKGAMAHYLADRPVGEAPWKRTLSDADAAEARSRPAGVTPGNLLGRVYVAPRIFRERFADAMQHTSMGRLFAALDLAEADACIFSARVNGRAITLVDATLQNGRMGLTPWTVDLPGDASLLRAVPEDATGYLVLNVQWPLMYDRLTALLDAIISDPTDMTVAQTLAEVARRQNVDIRRDILDRLQPYVLVHDSPQHPLRLPLMVTAVAAAQAGGDEKVRAALAKLTAEAAAEIDQKAAAGARAGKSPPVAIEPAPGAAPPGATARAPAPGDFTRLRIRTDSDGTSYLQFGLVGPGWGWVQNRLVVSWSPGAVRANAAAAGRVTSSAFAPATSQP